MYNFEVPIKPIKPSNLCYLFLALSTDFEEVLNIVSSIIVLATATLKFYGKDQQPL